MKAKKAKPFSFTTSHRNDAELEAMNQVREALAEILPKRNDILSTSAYALQADKLQGRSATIMRAQGVEASVGIYGCTCFG